MSLLRELYKEEIIQLRESGENKSNIANILIDKYKLADKFETVRSAVRSVLKGYNKPSYRITSVSEPSDHVVKLDKILDRMLVNSVEPFLTGDVNNVLVIGDTHEPFCKDGYLEHCRRTQEVYNCGTVVHIGDLTDNHAVSYHEKDPEGRSAGDEFLLALEACKRWYYTFPNVKVCIGNHDALPFRKIFSAGLPSYWLKSYQEMLESPPTWDWNFIHIIKDVIYTHGTGMSGEMAAINATRENRQSTVIGHLHTVMNTRFLASYKDLIFGMSVGCGIDYEKYAFAYGKQNSRKPVISCGVVINGKLPINIPMDL